MKAFFKRYEAISFLNSHVGSAFTLRSFHFIGNEGGSSFLSAAPIHVSQGLVKRMLSNPFVSWEIATPTARVGELISPVLPHIHSDRNINIGTTAPKENLHTSQ